MDGAAAEGGDGSSSRPFAALAQAEGVTAGTEIRVRGRVVARPGRQYGLAFSGTPEAPIWITGEPGAVLVGRDGGADDVAALRLTRSRYLIVQNLEITAGPNHALHFDASSYLLFRRLHVHHAREACIKGSQSDHVYVEDSDLHHAGALPGGDELSTQVLDFVGVNGGHVVRSRIHHGPQVMVMLKGGTSDLLFAFNEVFGQGATEEAAVQLGQSTSPEFFQPLDADYEARNVVAHANWIHDVAGPGLAFQGADRCVATHNTITGVGGPQLIRFLPGNAGKASGKKESRTRGCRFAGNVIVGTDAEAASLNADESAIGAGNLVDHNAWWKPGALNWWSAIPQDTQFSTYDRDPRVGADGLPGELAVVRRRGPADLNGTAFSPVLGADYRGACAPPPLDLGAFRAP